MRENKVISKLLYGGKIGNINYKVQIIYRYLDTFPNFAYSVPRSMVLPSN